MRVIETPLDALHEYLKSMPTLSAVKDSIQILTRRVLERTALSLGATHLLLGRSMSSLSKALLSNICSGRAFTISDEYKSFCDGLTSFNPLHDVGSKECAASLWWRGLRVISSPIQQPDVANSSTSISELTRGS
jgi:cytoplasmic tRNA 2-thiolation protein 2